MRVCFLLNVRPESVDEYKARHSRVWPELQDALRNAGWKNYSLFLRSDGILVGYLEAEDFARCREEMKLHCVNERWQAEMTPFFENMEEVGADDNMKPLQEVFHLD